jgi:hypothetical protein
MAGEVAAPLGELFVLLIPTQSKVRTCSSCKQNQQLIIFNIIKEFGFDIEVIVQVPRRVRSEINRGISIFPRITTGPEQHPARAAESRRVSDCIHLGYLSDFLIIRGVPQYSTLHRRPRVLPPVAASIKRRHNNHGHNHPHPT